MRKKLVNHLHFEYLDLADRLARTNYLITRAESSIVRGLLP